MELIETMPGGKPYTPREVEYIKKAVKRSLPADAIASRLHRTITAVELKIRQMKTAGIIPRYIYAHAENPNEITDTTVMLICRYHKDNLRKGMDEDDAIYDISDILCRSVKTVIEILDACQADGRYERYNLYGSTK